MVAKSKKVDSIISSAEEVEEVYSPTPKVVSDALLDGSVSDTAAVETKDFVAPKKWYIWTRTPKANQPDKVKVAITKEKKPKVSKKKDPTESPVKAEKVVERANPKDMSEKSPLFSFFKKKQAQDTHEKEGDERFLKRHHKIAVILTVTVITLVVLVSLVGGGAYAHKAIYENKVFPGVVVWGEDVGGKSVNEVQQLITRKAKEYNIVIKGPDQDYKATVQDLGIIFNSDSMALSAFSRGRSDVIVDDLLTRSRLLLTEIRWQPFQRYVRSNDLAIAPSYTVNQEKLTAYLTKVADNIRIQAQDSEVTVTGGATQLKPAIYGRDVELSALKESVLASITALQTEKIDVDIKVIKPAIVDTAAQEVMLQAQTVMARPVVLTYKGTEYRPNQDTVGSWISFTKNAGDVKYTLVIDKLKLASYFSFLGSKINVYSTQRIVRVENGVKQTEAQAGADGLLVDTALLGDQIVATLPNQPSVKLEIPTYVDKFKTKYENVVIADWDKYIDVNLATQTMTACEKGGVNCRQWRVMTGKDSTPTPVGTWLVQGRSANFWMTGLESTPEYYRLWVPFATWFKGGGYAIHSAQWRNNDPNSTNGFGNQSYRWNGSHGCVNSPDDAAQFIYDWAPVGTPVIVHY